MEGSAVRHVVQCKSVCKMRQIQETLFERKSEISLHLLNEQFCNLKFKDNDSVTSFNTKVNNNVGKFKKW